MKRDYRDDLYDILNVIESIKEFIRDYDCYEFEKNDKNESKK